MVPAARPVSEWLVALALLVATVDQLLSSSDRSTSKPSSSEELSVQVRSIWLEEAAFAWRLVGAAGGSFHGVEQTHD